MQSAKSVPIRARRSSARQRIVSSETTSIGGLELTFEVIEPGHFFLQVATPKS